MKRILLIVEGEKAEPKLLGKLNSIFFKTENILIWPYKTNIYDLYKKCIETDANFNDLDIKQVIKSTENDEQIKAKIDEQYTDIVLVFDFDPQDPLFSGDKLSKMTDFFSNSTDNGKLYINYPMVESFKHIKKKGDGNFDDIAFYNQKATSEEVLQKNIKKLFL